MRDESIFPRCINNEYVVKSNLGPECHVFIQYVVRGLHSGMGSGVLVINRSVIESGGRGKSSSSNISE